MKILLTILKITTLLVFVGIMVLTIGAYLNLPLPLKPLVVKTGSMAPTIPVGSLVLVTEKSSNSYGINYVEGEVITFRSGKELVSHRVVRVDRATGEKRFVTKGDANQNIDTKLISEKDVVGKVSLAVPYVGKFVDFVKTPLGFFLLIVIPTLFIILSEVVAVWEELRKKHSSSGGNLDFAKPLAMFFMAAIFMGSSHAFFSDVATSTNNTFTAAQVFTNHLVINEVMFNPPNENVCGNEGDAEWVEIYNPTASPVNLDSWLIGDSLFTDDLPNVSLPAGGFAVISDCTQSNFSSIWTFPGSTIYIDLASAIGNGLNNGGENIRLFNAATLVDQMSYGTNTTAFSPSAPAPVANHSLERNPDGVDTDTAADFVDRTTPTPGS